MCKTLAKLQVGLLHGRVSRSAVAIVGCVVMGSITLSWLLLIRLT